MSGRHPESNPAPYYRLLLVAVIGLSFMAGNLVLERWKKNLYYGDSSHYYLHVVSFFIYNDVGDYDKTITSLRTANPDSADPREDIYGVRLTEKGRRYIKYTVGVPVMEAPFFWMAHAYAKWITTDEYEPTGWSRPYLFMMSVATIVYLMLGFYLLIGVLERYFSRRVTTVVVLTLALATNLFYHATYVTMAHGFLFFDYCLLIALTIGFYARPDWRRALGIGMVVGLIAITRVPEVIAGLIPLFWGITNWRTLQERVVFVWRNIPLVVVAGVGFSLFLSLQVAYWYYVSDKFYFNPYQGEGFDFAHPKIHRGWFDFANGWLIYTPVMAFSLLGLGVLRRYLAAAFWPIVLFVGLHSYIHYSYYAWTFFPGMGQRPMVETYPLLALSLAAMYAYFSQYKLTRWIPWAALVGFGVLNIFQVWQMREGITWTERHNYGFYVETFGRLSPHLNALRAYDCREPQPDSADIEVVKVLLTEDFSGPQWDSLALDTFGRQRIVPVTDEFLNFAVRIPLDGLDYDYLGLRVSVYTPVEGRVPHRDILANAVLAIDHADGSKVKVNSIKPSSYIGNPDYYIWPSGEVGQWGEAGFFQRRSSRARPGDYLKVYAHNPNRQLIYFDEVEVVAYRKK